MCDDDDDILIEAKQYTQQMEQLCVDMPMFTHTHTLTSTVVHTRINSNTHTQHKIVNS